MEVYNQKIGKPNNLKVFRKPKGVNMRAKLG